jgi:soluble lytic murein transglycosylase-like protein
MASRGTSGVKAGLIALALWVSATAAQAGRQIEEPLADAVRTALSAAVSDSGPPRIEFDQVDERLAYLRWLGATSERLKQRKPEFNVRREFLETVWYESRRAGLDVSLVLALIEVESGFRKYAISSAGARGYMQVMPFWLRLLAPRPGDGLTIPSATPVWPGDLPNPTNWAAPRAGRGRAPVQPPARLSDEDVGRMFHLQTNLRFGCVILRHYLDREQGNLFMALGAYNGSRGQAPYPNMVLGARKRWMQPSPAVTPSRDAARPIELNRTGASGRMAGEQ